MRPLVSIIVPVYNVEKYLDRCLTSIVNQTYKNIEIIVIDDGSTDSSTLKCDEWSQKDSRIKVIHQENQGIACTRNTGIKNISGKYFIAIDSDDHIYLNAIEYLVNALEESSSDVAMYKFYFSFNQKMPRKMPKSKRPLKYYIREGWGISEEVFLSMDYQTFFWNKMWRSEAVKDIYFNSNLDCFEDIDILPHFLKACKKGVFLKNHLLKYMIRSNSLSHTTFKLKDKLELLLDICSQCEIKYNNWYPQLGENIRYWWALEYIFISNDKVPRSFKKEKWDMLFEENLLSNYKKHSKGFLSSPYNFMYKALYIKLSIRLFYYNMHKHK